MGKEASFDFSDLIDGGAQLIAETSPGFTGGNEGGNEEVEDKNTKSSLTKASEAELIKKDIEFIVGTPPDLGDEDDDEQVDDDEANEEKEKSPSSKDTKDASGSFALAFAKFQQEEGVISELNEEELTKVIEEEGEVGALKYLLEIQRNAIYEEAKSVYSADQAALKEYFEMRDADVDEELAKELAFNKGKFDSITPDKLEEDEKLRKSILTQHYKLTTTFNDTKIKKLVEQSITTGEDIDEAKEALNELKVINEKQIAEAKKQVEVQEKNRLAQVKAYQEEFKKFVYEKDEFFKDMKINKQTKDKLIDMVLKPVEKDANGTPLNAIWAERAKDPKKFDAYVAMHLLNGTFYGDLGKIKTKAKTSAITELEKHLETKNKGLGGKTVSKSAGSSIMEQFLREGQNY